MCAFIQVGTFLCGLNRKLSCSCGVDADELSSPALVFEFHKAFDQGEERIVLASANIIARLPFCTTLSRQNIAAKHMFAAELLETEPLCV